MITLWHNPRCSKSRAALAIFEAAKRPFVVRKYLEDAPTYEELKAVSEALGAPAAQMIRQGEAVFKELDLKDADDETLLRAMADHPILIERPIALRDTRAVIGRPPEAIKVVL